MFTRQHYQAIANFIQDATLDDDRMNEGYVIERSRLMADIADMFKADNPRFDRQRFYDAAYGDKQPAV